MNADEAACTYALQLGSACVLPMTLKAAIELGLLDQIAAAGTLSADELAARLGASNPHAAAMIDRILRLLASYSILSTTPSGEVLRYGTTAVSKYLTPDEDGASFAALCLMAQDKVAIDSWYYLKEAVMNGGVAFNNGHGGLTEFEYHATDARFSKLFNDGMRNHSVILLKKILEKYGGFDGVKVLVDVGGGTGSTLSTILAKHPHIKGINFDLPHVIAQAPVAEGVEHVAGDAFSCVPTGDAILLKWILHDWNDEDCIKILKNCWNALPKHGSVIVIDYILPETLEISRTTQMVCHVDMIMLLESPSGKERTKKEFEELAMKSGFTRFLAPVSFSGVWVMEYIKEI